MTQPNQQEITLYGKQLAQTGAALAGVTVLGVNFPYLAIGAALLVVTGALFLRLKHKTSATR